MNQVPAKGNSVLIATMVGLFAIAVLGGLLIGKEVHPKTHHRSSRLLEGHFFIRECVHLAMGLKEGVMGFLRRI